MKLGLYTITYLGLWYRGEALPLTGVIKKAHMRQDRAQTVIGMRQIALE